MAFESHEHLLMSLSPHSLTLHFQALYNQGQQLISWLYLHSPSEETLTQNRTQMYKKKTCKAKKKKQHRQSIMKEQTSKNTPESFSSFLVVHLLLTIIFRVACISRETPLEKSNFFLCEQLTIGDRYLIRDGSWSTSPLSIDAPSDLDLCRLCACCYSLCEFICMSVLLCPNSLFPWHPLSPCSYNLFASSSEKFSDP